MTASLHQDNRLYEFYLQLFFSFNILYLSSLHISKCCCSSDIYSAQSHNIDVCFMERDSLQPARNFQTFQRSLLPPSSGMVNVPNFMALCPRRHVRISVLTWTWVSSQALFKVAQKCCFCCLMLFIPSSGEFVYNGC